MINFPSNYVAILKTIRLTWDPTVRLSMLSVILGGTLHKIQSSDVNQVSIQRFLSLPSYQHAKRCMLIFTLLLVFLLSCCSYMGLVSYAVYHDCDPISTKVSKLSRKIPLYIDIEFQLEFFKNTYQLLSI